MGGGKYLINNKIVYLLHTKKYLHTLLYAIFFVFCYNEIKIKEI